MIKKWILKSAAVGVTLVTAYMLFEHLEMHDIGEVSGGQLTGPFLGFGFLGCLTLIFSAFVSVTLPRPAFYACAIAMLMALPWFSWRLFPGYWCSSGNCDPMGGRYPWFAFEQDIFLLLALFALTLLLQRVSFAK